MESRGALQIDPGALDTSSASEDLEIVVPFTEWSLADAVLKRAAALTAGLHARLVLIAVHTIPYPAQFGCPTSVHAHLVGQLTDLASRCPLPIQPHVVLARSRDEGFRHLLNPNSTILVGSRKHWWRTPEEKLARSLARDGHRVALLHVA